jgi:hypothetical protein
MAKAHLIAESAKEVSQPQFVTEGAAFLALPAFVPRPLHAR